MILVALKRNSVGRGRYVVFHIHMLMMFVLRPYLFFLLSIVREQKINMAADVVDTFL